MEPKAASYYSRATGQREREKSKDSAQSRRPVSQQRLASPSAQQAYQQASPISSSPRLRAKALMYRGPPPPAPASIKPPDWPPPPPANHYVPPEDSSSDDEEAYLEPPLRPLPARLIEEVTLPAHDPALAKLYDADPTLAATLQARMRQISLQTRLVVATPPPSPPPLEVDDAEAHASEIELQVQDEARSLAPAPTAVLFRGLSRPDVGRHLMSNRSKLGLRITPRMVLPGSSRRRQKEPSKMPPAAAAAPAELRATTSASAFLPKSMRIGNGVGACGSSASLGVVAKDDGTGHYGAHLRGLKEIGSVPTSPIQANHSPNASLGGGTVAAYKAEMVATSPEDWVANAFAVCAEAVATSTGWLTSIAAHHANR